MSKPIERERIEQCARIYGSNAEAARALGIAPDSFGRLCRKYGIESPYARRARLAAATEQRRRDRP